MADCLLGCRWVCLLAARQGSKHFTERWMGASEARWLLWFIGISDGAIYVFSHGHNDSCWVTRFRPHSNHTLPILSASLPRDCIRQSYRRAWTKAERQIVGLDRYEKARRLRWVRRRQSQRRMILCRVTRGVRGEARQGKACTGLGVCVCVCV